MFTGPSFYKRKLAESDGDMAASAASHRDDVVDNEDDDHQWKRRKRRSTGTRDYGSGAFPIVLFSSGAFLNIQ